MHQGRFSLLHLWRHPPRSSHYLRQRRTVRRRPVTFPPPRPHIKPKCKEVRVTRRAKAPETPSLMKCLRVSAASWTLRNARSRAFCQMVAPAHPWHLHLQSNRAWSRDLRHTQARRRGPCNHKPAIRPPAPSQRWDQPQRVHRQQPSLGPAADPNFPAGRTGTPQGYGFQERPAPPLVHDGRTHSQREPRRGRRPKETPRQLLQAIEHLPRKAHIAVPETIQIGLSKEDIAAIFGQVSHPAHTQGGKLPAACRAVTMRLSAPEGGFFVEPTAPETQWVFDRPAFLGEEAVGTWTWTVVPNERGSHFLVVSMSARDLDENGLAGDISLPDQAIQIRVRGSFWRGLWRLISTALLLLAGSGITIGAFYALKLLGKLPPIFLK